MVCRKCTTELVEELDSLEEGSLTGSKVRIIATSGDGFQLSKGNDQKYALSPHKKILTAGAISHKRDLARVAMVSTTDTVVS